jgi:hypothetical protein
MRRSPVPGVDLSVYVNALPLLLRNPAIIVVPLLALVVGVLIDLALAPGSGGLMGSATFGLGQLLSFLLALFGLGSACIMADGAWRRGRMPFDTAWTQTQHKGGDILFAAIGVSLLLSVGQYVSQLFGSIGLLLSAVMVCFLIWAIPAAAVGGVPGGAAIQVSIERVRSAPLAAALATIVTLVLVFYAAGALSLAIAGLLGPAASGIVVALLFALLRSIAIGYVALILTKTYTDAAFTRPPWL